MERCTGMPSSSGGGTLPGVHDAVLGQPARQELAGDLAVRPPERGALGVAATAQPAGALADQEAPVEHRLARVDDVTPASLATPAAASRA